MKLSSGKLAIDGLPLSSYAWFNERRMVAFTVGVGLLLSVLVDIPFFMSGYHTRVYIQHEEKPCRENSMSVQIITYALGTCDTKS